MMHVLSVQRRDLERSANKSFGRLLSFEPTLGLLWCGGTVAVSAFVVFVDYLDCDDNCRRNLVGVVGMLQLLMMKLTWETLKSES